MITASKNFIRLLVALLTGTLTLLALSATVLGASIIDRSETGSLTIQPTYSGTAVSGCTFQIYRVATIDDTVSLRYTLAAPFDAAARSAAEGGQGLDINAVKTNADQISAAAILAGYTSGVDADESLGAGQTTVKGLNLGVYLVVQTSAPGKYIKSNPFLAFLPICNEEGTDWLYQYAAQPKLGYSSSTHAKKTSVTVIKVWNDAGSEGSRPESVDVTLLRDGEDYDTATLSEDNHWTYEWSKLSAEDDWSVDESVVPDGYSAFIADNGDDSFTITNTREDVPLGSTFTAQKVWADNDDQAGERPDSVCVTLYQDGAAYDTVNLSEDNDWSYLWVGLDAGSQWTVSENYVPDGYTVSVEQVATGCTIVNTYGGGSTAEVADMPDDNVPLGAGGISAPKTGLVQWPIPVLFSAGMILIAFGMFGGPGKRRHVK